MMNWSEWEPEESQRATISPYWALIAIVLGVALAMALWAGGVRADPIARAEGDNGAAITLYNEPCELKDQITNLPFKASWVEGDKTYRGCWGPYQPLNLVIFYFDDKTVGPIPFQALRRVVGA